MKGKTSDICSKCKHSEGTVEDSYYICGVSHSNGGLYHLMPAEDELYCTAYEEVNMNKVEGKVSDICPICKNCKSTSWGVYDEKNEGLTEIECEDPYDGVTKTLDADSDVCCSMFEEKKEKEPFNLNMRYALRKDETIDESISCVRDIPSDVEMIEDLKKRAADSDYYKEKSELLEERNNNQFNTIREKNRKISEMEEKLKKANELADSWKRDYETCRDQIIHPIYNILYPDKPDLDINVTDFINDVKTLKVYADENEKMYKEIQRLRDVYTSRGNEIDRLLSENKEKDKKISILEPRVKYWSNIATGNADKITKFKKDRDKWRSLYNSLSETYADYNKRGKEECEKKYHDEISKLQNIVTEKDNVYLYQNNALADAIFEKNAELNQTISDQEVTIKAPLITIKEMCKEDETNE